LCECVECRERLNSVPKSKNRQGVEEESKELSLAAIDRGDACGPLSLGYYYKLHISYIIWCPGSQSVFSSYIAGEEVNEMCTRSLWDSILTSFVATTAMIEREREREFCRKEDEGRNYIQI
jgi:hypothetical protein